MSPEFNDTQFNQAYSDGVENHWWNIARSHIILRCLKKFAQGGRTIEVGCGRGIVVHSLRKGGFDCVGVEAAPCTPLSEVKSYVTTETDVGALKNDERLTFKTLLLLDVIEHIDDPFAFLSNLLESLPALRKVLITVPARRELWTNYDEFYGHRRRYTPQMLCELTKNLPINLEFQSYFFHALYLPLWLMRLFGRERRTIIRPPADRFILGHQAIARFMILDYNLLPSRLPGSSLLTVYKVSRENVDD